MSLVCPHCHSEQAEESAQCNHCGQPWISNAMPDTARDGDKRFPFWNLLPWSLFAAAMVLLAPHLRPHQAPAVSSGPAVSPNPAEITPATETSLPAAAPHLTPAPAVAAPAPRAETAPAAQVPLMVTLYSAGDGKHVHVGTPVMISAFASLAPGRSATLAISYSKGSGPKSLLSLAQGSLSSSAWTPLTPGQYEFTASALDSRRNSTFSHRLIIWADAPAAAGPSAKTPSLPKPSLASKPSVILKANLVPKPKPLLIHVKLPAAPIAVKSPVKHTPAPHVVPKVSPAPLPYHVAAAAFPVRQIAETLAGALRRRGFNVIVRPSAKGRTPPKYTVETGDYFLQADAQKQQRILQRDGYPAFIFRFRD